MTSIYGVLGVSDSDRIYLNTIGQQVSYEAAQQVIAERNAQLEMTRSIFIDRVSEEFAIRYRLPGGGRMQRVNNNSSAGAVKTRGYWDVQFPLESFEDQLAVNRIGFAYMTTEDLNREVEGIAERNRNTLRFEILKALFNNTNRTVQDEIRGALTIKPLANGDSDVYPPVEGATTEATQTNYETSGYIASAISDTNNPWKKITPKLMGNFGGISSNGDPVVTFINEAQRDQISALAGFKEADDRFIRYGQNSDHPEQIQNVPGAIIGRMLGRAYVSVWNWVPADYMLSIHLEAPKPLIKRCDPAFTGLPRELELIAKDSEHPFESSYYHHRFGVGAANRLNGHVLQLTASGSYSIPAAYA
jgi:hypothetical protein